MGFEDIFENSHRHHKDRHYGNFNHNYDDRYNHGYDHDDHMHNTQSYHHKNDFKQQLLSRLQNDPRLRSYIFIGAVAVIIILVIAAFMLLPLLIKLLNFLGQNGIQGIIDTLWKGKG